MYYVFSNANKLLELAKKKKWDELIAELENSQLVIPSSYHGVCPSAKEVYRKVCEMIVEDKKEELLTCSEHVSKMFADCWDVEALEMMRGSSARFGKLHEEAYNVLKEYKHYKALALAEFEAHRSNRSVKPFEKEAEGVRIVFESGRLRFYKNDTEYTIFRSVAY